MSTGASEVLLLEVLGSLRGSQAMSLGRVGGLQRVLILGARNQHLLIFKQ